MLVVLSRKVIISYIGLDGGLLLASKHRSPCRQDLMLLGLKFCQICFILGTFHSLLFNDRDLLCQ